MGTKPKNIEKLKAKYAEPLPIDEKVHLWAMDTIEAIRKNFSTQGIFPAGEPYSGYKESNSKNQGTRWKSTGAGFDSFYFHVLQASENQNMVPVDVGVKILYNYYLKFVDLGVMKGLKADQVQRSRTAQHDQRYFNEWSPSTGDTMRPAISMEIDYQSARLARYLTRRYEHDAQMVILNAVDGLEIKLD